MKEHGARRRLQALGEVMPAAPGKARMERDLTEGCGGQALRRCLNRCRLQQSRAGVEAQGWCGNAGSR